MKASERFGTPDLFEEAFRWDQHLHTFCFRESLRNGNKMPNPALFELCKLTGGSYTSIHSFSHLKTQIERLAHSSITEVCIKIEQRLVQCFFNVQAKVKRPQMQQVRGQQGM